MGCSEKHKKAHPRAYFPPPQNGHCITNKARIKKICSYAAIGGDKPEEMVKCPIPQNVQRVISLPVSFFIKSATESFILTVTVAPVSFLHKASFFRLTAEARKP
jgi:hypothetical protein